MFALVLLFATNTIFNFKKIMDFFANPSSATGVHYVIIPA